MQWGQLPGEGSAPGPQAEVTVAGATPHKQTNKQTKIFTPERCLSAPLPCPCCSVFIPLSSGHFQGLTAGALPPLFPGARWAPALRSPGCQSHSARTWGAGPCLLPPLSGRHPGPTPPSRPARRLLAGGGPHPAFPCPRDSFLWSVSILLVGQLWGILVPTLWVGVGIRQVSGLCGVLRVGCSLLGGGARLGPAVRPQPELAERSRSQRVSGSPRFFLPLCSFVLWRVLECWLPWESWEEGQAWGLGLCVFLPHDFCRGFIFRGVRLFVFREQVSF